MASPPTNYAEWLPLLDRFRAGDNEVLTVMHHGRIEWTSVVAERFARELGSTLGARLGEVSSQLQKRLNRATSSVDVRTALAWAQAQLPPLWSFCQLPTLEAGVAEFLNEECSRWVTSTLSSLQSSAQTQRDGGVLARQIRQSVLRWPPVTADDATADSGVVTDEPPLPAPATGRRRILQ